MSEDQAPFLHDRDFADMLAKTCSELALLQGRFRSRPTKVGRPAGVARALLSERRMRESIFTKGLFGEPAWDLLIHELQHLSERSDHFHLAPESMHGDVPLQTAPYRDGDKVIAWAKVMLRTAAWDATYFPHVIKA